MLWDRGKKGFVRPRKINTLLQLFFLRFWQFDPPALPALLLVEVVSQTTHVVLEDVTLP